MICEDAWRYKSGSGSKKETDTHSDLGVAYAGVPYKNYVVSQEIESG